VPGGAALAGAEGIPRVIKICGFAEFFVLILIFSEKPKDGDKNEEESQNIMTHGTSWRFLTAPTRSLLFARLNGLHMV
jgi:hypothetical protein